MHPDAAILSGTEPAIASREPLLLPRLPSLDGWRALSICLVLGWHSRFTFDCPSKASRFLETYFDGSLGVRFFFVISGFLITYLLLKEHLETGKINLRNFYARRALRILPVYFTYLAVVFALQIFTPYRQPGVSWAANLTFTTNFFPLNWTTGHLWSLAVEEQFYLLWPIILSVARPQNRRRVLLILCLPIIAAPFCRLIGIDKLTPTPLRPLFHQYSFFTQFDSLAIGCMAAMLLVHHREKMFALLTRFSRTSLVVGTALVIVTQALVKSWVAVYVSMYVGESVTVPLANTFQAIGFSILLLQSILLPELFKQLNWSVIRQIGALSYSIYMWQMLFSFHPGRFGLLHPWFMSFRFWWVAVLLVSLCSYYVVEKPFLSLRRHFSASPNRVVPA